MPKVTRCPAARGRGGPLDGVEKRRHIGDRMIRGHHQNQRLGIALGEAQGGHRRRRRGVAADRLQQDRARRDPISRSCSAMMKRCSSLAMITAARTPGIGDPQRGLLEQALVADQRQELLR